MKSILYPLKYLVIVYFPNNLYASKDILNLALSSYNIFSFRFP
nr:MAG TPA: hypothetical protein [Crassvirales sp.]